MALKILLGIAALTILGCGFVESARGGGARGGSRGGYRGGYRASSSSRSYRATSVRTWSSSQKSVAATLGTIYIARRFRTRYGVGDGWSDDLNVCRNSELYKNYNGSTSVYGFFLCPTDNVTEDKTYCCGDDGFQYCCDFWTSEGVKVIVGSVFGGLVVLGALGALIVYLVVVHNKKKARTQPVSFSNDRAFYSGSTVSVGNKAGDPPAYADATAYSNSVQYPPVDAAYPPPATSYPPTQVPNQPPPPYPLSPPPTAYQQPS